MSTVKIFEQLLQKDGEKISKMAIFFCDVKSPNPQAEINCAVDRYTKQIAVSQYTDIRLDNPWIRVVIHNLNELKFEDFNKQTL